MPLKKFSLKTTVDHQKKRLDQVLALWLPQALHEPISKGKVRKLIMAGAVYLNRKRVRIASKELMPNALIEVYIDWTKLTSSEEKQSLSEFTLTSDRILYEDPYLIIINKPEGLPTQPTLDEARINLFAAVKKFLARRDRIPEPQVYLGLHHRLDRDTSGVILFTKSKEANPGIAELFKNHQIQKTYVALTALPKGGNGQPPHTWQVKNYLARVGRQGKITKFGSVRSGGDPALTEFKLLEKHKEYLLIEAKPKTGRTHQIRVHLSEYGLPILGDRLYGGPAQVGERTISRPISRMMLHALRLEFQHPITGEEMKIEAPNFKFL